MNMWSIIDSTINKSDVTAFNKGVAQTVQNFQVKARLKRLEEVVKSKDMAEIFIDLVKDYKPPILNIKSTNKNVDSENNLLEISIYDLHLGKLCWAKETGEDYDVNIASKRFKLLAERAKQYFKTVNISNILLAFTGDIINNDVLLDKLLNEATNRSKATMLAFYIIEQFIIDLNKDYNITIAGVSGNEGRKKIELGFSEILTSDNYDYTILNMLKIAFRNSKGIAFNEGNSSEQVINIAGSNILILHGLSLKTEIEKSVQQLIGK